MAEYIEREAVTTLFARACGECKEACEEFDGFYADCNQCLLHGVLKEFAAIPAADVRPVVTCGRCKYADSFPPTCTESTFPLKCLSIRYGGVYPDWFCEHGEIAQKSNCGADMREES